MVDAALPGRDRRPDAGRRRGAGRRLGAPGVDRDARGSRRERGHAGSGCGGRPTSWVTGPTPRPAAAQRAQPAARRVPSASSTPSTAIWSAGSTPPPTGSATNSRSARSRPAGTSGSAVGSLLQDRCEALILLGPAPTDPDLAGLAARLPVVVVARAVHDRGGRRRPHGGRSRAGPGRRSPRRAGSPADRARRRRSRARRGRPAPRLPPGHAPPRPGRRDRVVPGGLTEEDGALAARALLGRRPPPTAVTVFNDRCALACSTSLRRAGRRPCPATSASSASTTAGSPASRTST